MSKLEAPLHGDVDFRSTNAAEYHCVPFSHTCSYPVVRWWIFTYVCEGVSVSVSCRNWHNLLHGGASKLETHLRGDVNFRSTNEVEVLTFMSF
jgi:hypothetical protein